MLRIDKATGLDDGDGKRALVYKDGVQIGDVRITRDNSAWQFCVTADKDVTQGQTVAALAGEELRQLHKVVSTRKV